MWWRGGWRICRGYGGGWEVWAEGTVVEVEVDEGMGNVGV